MASIRSHSVQDTVMRGLELAQSTLRGDRRFRGPVAKSAATIPAPCRTQPRRPRQGLPRDDAQMDAVKRRWPDR